MAGCFEKNVFVNCPFDDDYRDILLGILYTVLYFGFTPRISLESSDSSETRIHKILELIKESKLGIHDLSRIVSLSEGEHYRMNMPFELGIDYGCKKLGKKQHLSKKILILESERYRFQKAISDLSGSDIKHHNNDVLSAIRAVRDWIISEELNSGDSSDHIWDSYNDFQAYLYDKVVVEDKHLSIDNVQIVELIYHMKTWFSSEKVKYK